MHRLTEIQAAIRAEGVDGWLLYDFKDLNPIARRVAGIPADRFLSRRWACFIPATGAPRWLLHAIEAGSMADLAPGAATYISWQAWREGLAALLAGAGRVALEVSPGCAIPYISRVDAGTVELIRGLGVEVVTSADIVQVAEAVWSPAATGQPPPRLRRADPGPGRNLRARPRTAGGGAGGDRVRHPGLHDGAVCQPGTRNRSSAHRRRQRPRSRPALHAAAGCRQAPASGRFSVARSLGQGTRAGWHLRRHHLGGLRGPRSLAPHPAGV